MKRIFTKVSVFTFLCLLLANVALAQDITVKGVVRDQSDQTTIPGATVQVKGTTRTVQTDVNGNYTISAPTNGTLVFSFIGFTTRELPVNNQTTVNVTLGSATQDLEAVVVVGYGTQKRRDLTGAITSVSGEDIARQPATNPVASLQGKVAGLTVANSGQAGASPVVRIRGINSTNSASPLYVVDGILQDNIDYLNPGDIESIDLLRDPSSIAIYGLRGANGVIAVTTRKAARGKTRVSLQSNVGIQTVTDLIDVTDAEGFKKLYSAQLANQGAAPFDFSNYTANTNWQEQILQDAVINTNTLSISNTGEKTTTSISLGYNNQDGVLKYNNYQKYIARVSEEIRISDKIKIGTDLNGFHWIDNPAAATLNSALWAAPVIPIQQDENTYYATPSFQRVQVGNPVAALHRNNRNSINKGYRLVGSLYGEVNFLKDFTLRSVVYTDLGFNNTRGYSALPYTFINIGENGAPNTTTFDNSIRTSVRQQQEEFRKFQQDHTLTFNKLLGDHSITALAGFTSVTSSSTNINGNRSDLVLDIPNNPDFWYIGVVNPNNPGNYGGGGSNESNVGIFGRVNYSFANRYLLNATIRRDASSKFAPENRWGTFGSLGLGWVASEENFFKENIKGIDFLKVRAAWGKLGNSNGVPNYLYRPGISNASTAVFGENVFTAVQAAYIPDPNLHWEVVEGLDLGLDIRALTNRLNAEINYYNRTTTDILTSFPLPNETRSYFTNLGKITNRGVEVSIGWNDKIGEEFTYGVSGNFSYNKNVVNSIGNTSNFQIIGNSGANLTETGQSIGYFYGYRQVGIYQSTFDLGNSPSMSNSLPGDIAYSDVNGDGVISPADRTYLGTPFPPYNYGLSVNFGYKGFDMMIDGQGVAGNKIYTQRRTAVFAPLNFEANRLNAWTAPGTSNVEPIIDNSRGNNYLFSSYYLEPGDYFRLRNVQLGYTFGAEAFGKLPIQNVRLYISGQNIKTWSKVTGYSPEAQIGSITGGGADNGVYPVPAIYSFGLNVTF